MNDKDAFKKWFDVLGDSFLERVIKLNRGASYQAWQAACEYKQKYINELEAENAKLNQEIEKFKIYLEAWRIDE